MTGAHSSGGACGLIRAYAKNLILDLTCAKAVGSRTRKREPTVSSPEPTTGAAWLSSARVVRCRVKSHNERNPCFQLLTLRARTLEKLPVLNRRKVGMTSSPHGLYVQGCTRATMVCTEGCQRASGSKSQKTDPSSDRRLQLACVKLESLVIAGQQHRGECVPEPCTHRPSSHEREGRPKSLHQVNADAGLPDWD